MLHLIVLVAELVLLVIKVLQRLCDYSFSTSSPVRILLFSPATPLVRFPCFVHCFYVTGR